MRINEVIYFSPSTKMIDLDFNNKDMILKSFKERIEEHYFKPLKELNSSKQAFGAGILIGSIADMFVAYFIGRKIEVREGGRLYQQWLKENIEFIKHNDKKDDIAKAIYKNYRCGLLHEGYIKKYGEFSYEINSGIQFVTPLNDIIIINPEIMQEELERYFINYFKKIQINEEYYSNFLRCFRRQFEREVESLK